MKTTLEFRRLARAHCPKIRLGGGRGRTDRSAGVGASTPVETVPGDSPPQLVGLPYWKTGFSNGSFRKTLYTPSTLRIVVGEKWVPA